MQKRIASTYKKIVVVISVGAATVVLAAFGYYRTIPKSPLHPPVVQNPTGDRIPVLLMGSFINRNTDMSLDDVKKGLQDGTITCTGDLVNWAQGYFQLSKAPVVGTRSKFNFKSTAHTILSTIDSVDGRFLVHSINGTDFFKTPAAYPLWISKASANFDFTRHITSYVHTGVTALTRQTGVVLDQKGIDYYIENIRPYFQGKDWIHVSNEVSMQENCDYRSMRLQFATKTNHFEILRALHVNMVELTGNHNLDVGVDPYRTTIDWYRKNEIRYFGGGLTPAEANTPLILSTKDDQSVAWIGFNEVCPLGECADKKLGANRYNAVKAKKILDSLRAVKAIKTIIVCVQFGEIDSYQPTSTQVKIAQDLINWGADVIMGSQAHQAQEIRLYKNKIIFYGLGNFMFDQIHRVGVRQAFFLNCFFYKGKAIQFQPVYTYMNDQRQPTVADAVHKAEIQDLILKSVHF